MKERIVYHITLPFKILTFIKNGIIITKIIFYRTVFSSDGFDSRQPNRKGKLRWLINIVIVWGLTGFWHGAKWNFLVWGCYYAVLLIFEKLFILKLLKKIPAFFQWMYTSVLVIIGWVIFNLTDFGKMMHALKTMFVFSGTNILNAIAYDDTLITAVLYIPLGIFFAFPFAKRILDKIKNPIILNIITACLFFISVIYMISSSYNPFIYFRF